MPQKESHNFLIAKGDEKYGEKIVNYAAEAKKLTDNPEALAQLYRTTFPTKADSL